VAVKPGKRTVKYADHSRSHTYSAHSWTKLAPVHDGNTMITQQLNDAITRAEHCASDIVSDAESLTRSGGMGDAEALALSR